MTTLHDMHFMRHALRLAERGLGQTWPNPAVGAVLVRDGTIIGAGWTQPGGRPHAETMALEMAGLQPSPLGRGGSKAEGEGFSPPALHNTRPHPSPLPKGEGAVLYVTLEPCAHHGKTPPCADAIIAAGISRVVVAMRDPDPRVNGQGIARLRDAGVEVVEGVCTTEAADLNAGFFNVIQKQRPRVAVKIATSLDGKMALANGQSQWITGPTARAHAHRLRATHEAILTGIGTVLADDPMLTCRLPGLEHRSPLRMVVDSSLRIPLESALVRTARETPTWVFTCGTVDEQKAEALEMAGVKVLRCHAEGTRLDISEVLRLVAASGITRVLAEAGPTLSTALFRAGVVDRLHWFRAPKIMGGDAADAFGALGLETMADALRLHLQERCMLGDDVLEEYRIDACSPE